MERTDVGVDRKNRFSSRLKEHKFKFEINIATKVSKYVNVYQSSRFCLIEKKEKCTENTSISTKRTEKWLPANAPNKSSEKVI